MLESKEEWLAKNRVNMPVLRKAMDWAEAEAAKPDKKQCEWYQQAWRESAEDLGRECGTVYCIAGYIANEIVGAEVWGERTEYIAANVLNVPFGAVHSGLFSPDNTIDSVRYWAEELVATYGEPGETL